MPLLIRAFKILENENIYNVRKWSSKSRMKILVSVNKSLFQFYENFGDSGNIKKNTKVMKIYFKIYF